MVVRCDGSGRASGTLLRNGRYDGKAPDSKLEEKITLASGCFPLGTYIGGMAASIDAALKAVPAEVAAVTKLDSGNTVADMASHVPLAIEIGVRHKKDLAQLARERYDWTSVAAVLKRELRSLRQLHQFASPQ
jgi:hypothetical protein